MAPRHVGMLVGLTACALLLGCDTTSRYESVCQLIRREPVETDADGRTTVIDVELEWDACPGDQFQAVRGNAEFAACLAQYDVGDALPVVVRHWWDTRGYYVWDVESVGGCVHAIETGSQGSYEKSQECHEVVFHGVVAGFECNRQPFEQLVAVCPWMARE